jgi:rRNA small subunit pseudouridine methyltransferase Nep1
MDKLENKEKRGRSDIIHSCLLNALESITNKKYNNVLTYIHTVNDEIIRVNPKVRLPKHYERFKGVMAKLLYYGEIKHGSEYLFKKLDLSLEEFLGEFDVILLSERGKLVTNLEKKVKEIYSSYSNPLFVIGAFPKGDFRDIFYERAKEVISISDIPLTAWVVTYELITSFERVWLK